MRSGEGDGVMAGPFSYSRVLAPQTGPLPERCPWCRWPLSPVCCSRGAAYLAQRKESEQEALL